MTADRKPLLVTPIVILIAAGLAWAGSATSQTVFGAPVFALCVGVAFLAQWIVFVPAYLRQTEAFFDLTGAGSYLAVVTLAAVLTPPIELRSAVLWVLVVVWATRLGTFLFRRIRQAGKDDRFDEIKPDTLRFLNVWTIQGLWISLTSAAALAAITTGDGGVSATGAGVLLPGFGTGELDAFMIVGFLVWLTGFVIEVVADAQKSAFRRNPANRGRFISSGLWSWSRHPNYFGEITLWVGVAIVALPALHGWAYITLLSPVFVFLLLTRVSGVPLLEKKADAKWGGQAEYELYKEHTSVLVPRPPRR